MKNYITSSRKKSIQTLIILKQKILSNGFLFLPTNKKYEYDFATPKQKKLEYDLNMLHVKYFLVLAF